MAGGTPVPSPSEPVAPSGAVDRLFHIVAADDWRSAAAAGRYAPPSLEAEGFIHLSTAGQVQATTERFYATVPGLVLLELDPLRFDAPLRWEEGEPGEAFPHLYGSLDPRAVVAVHPWEAGDRGSVPRS